MDSNSKKNIILGITGSIAAVKVPAIISLLTKHNISVHVVMTENAARFVTPLTFRTLTRNQVIVSLWDEPEKWEPGHVALADKAELALVAPADANIIAKLACGIADDALSTELLTIRKPIILAPAMNPKMYASPVLQANIARIKSLLPDTEFAGPVSGPVACGAEGKGRMAEPEEIVAAVLKKLNIA